jgi:lipopolysaccharide export system protein LptC
MNTRLRLDAIVMLLLAALFAPTMSAQADDEEATLTEQPATPDPYTVDDPSGSTDPA